MLKLNTKSKCKNRKDQEHLTTNHRWIHEKLQKWWNVAVDWFIVKYRMVPLKSLDLFWTATNPGETGLTESRQLCRYIEVKVTYKMLPEKQDPYDKNNVTVPGSLWLPVSIAKSGGRGSDWVWLQLSSQKKKNT